MKACFPGSFDPITNGHMDLIERAAKLYDEVVVLIMTNVRKNSLFNEEERKQMIEKCIKDSHLDNVKVVIGTGLTVENASQLGCSVLVRGIRTVTDCEYELQQADANMLLDDEIETVFLPAKPKYGFLSSSVVREIGLFHGDIRSLVPACILKEVESRFD